MSEQNHARHLWTFVIAQSCMILFIHLQYVDNLSSVHPTLKCVLAAEPKHSEFNDSRGFCELWFVRMNQRKWPLLNDLYRYWSYNALHRVNLGCHKQRAGKSLWPLKQHGPKPWSRGVLSKWCSDVLVARSLCIFHLITPFEVSSLLQYAAYWLSSIIYSFMWQYSVSLKKL